MKQKNWLAGSEVDVRGMSCRRRGRLRSPRLARCPRTLGDQRAELARGLKGGGGDFDARADGERREAW